jgi:hypothetical protein
MRQTTPSASIGRASEAPGDSRPTTSCNAALPRLVTFT